jgi:phage tail-like protein
MPSFHFKVTLGDVKDALSGNFHEVNGLNSETQVIEYRHSANTTYSTIKMPGLQKFGNVTLKRGVFKSDNSFWTWYAQIKQNVIKRQTIVIELLDETSATIMKWTLNNAKFSGADMKSDGNDVAVVSLELAFETLLVETP